MSSHCILSRVCKWLLQFVATSFRDCFVLLFPGQLKCTCRQTCCKSGLSSHTRKVSPALCGIMATKNSLQELMLQVHCELQSYAVLCLAPCAVCHALRIYLEFVSFTWYWKTRHRNSHIALHTSRLSLTPHSRLALHVSQFALVCHTSLPCLTLRIRVLHFARLRDKHEVRDMSAKCKIRTQNAKHECEVRKLALV